MLFDYDRNESRVQYVYARHIVPIARLVRSDSSVLPSLPTFPPFRILHLAVTIPNLGNARRILLAALLSLFFLFFPAPLHLSIHSSILYFLF